MATYAKVEATLQTGGAQAQAGFLLLPQHVPLGAALFWQAADEIWRWAGDTAPTRTTTSKRALLASILATTIAVPHGVGPCPAREHLAARIEDVIATSAGSRGVKPWRYGRQLTGPWPASAYGRS